ncbi:MAG TPA: hypothetical protein ENL08_02205, partial [Bacteroidetes bacterium]|nr:hypothetical protein [Bacteroidota bacterium]
MHMAKEHGYFYQGVRIHKGLQIRSLSRSLSAVAILFFSPLTAFSQGLAINELMAANSSTVADEDGDYPDWIELLNTGRSEVHVGGYGLSDDADEPFKWIFPDIAIQAGEFRVIFASGKNRTPLEGRLHTNFCIRSAGEEIVLTDPEGRMIDGTQPVEMESDVSYGRIPDGGDEWFFFYQPTPGERNGDEPPHQPAPAPVLSLPSGFYRPNTLLTITCPDSSARVRFTTDGAIPSDTSDIYTDPLPLDSVIVIRAASYREGMMPSRVVSRTY